MATPTPLPTEEVSEAPTREPAQEPTQEPTEELWGFPIDDTHDAFEVPTGGKHGTVLVTVELEDEDAEEYRFSVWERDDLNQPIQTMTAEHLGSFHWHNIEDANFDGYMDFEYQFAQGVQASAWHLWCWDETAGQFVEEPEFSNISSPDVSAEYQMIYGWNRHSAEGDGVTTWHRWEDGKLVCIRRISVWSFWGEPTTLSVEDRVDGELREVYYKEYLWEDIKDDTEGDTSWMHEQTKWEDLNYHGEED